MTLPMSMLKDKKKASILEILSQDELRFNELSRKGSMRSNELSYHLNLLSDAGYICKDSEEKYKLTDGGKTVIPYLKFLREEEIPPTIFCAPVVVRGEKVLFVRRQKEPFKGYLEFPGGKMSRGETVIEAAIRELREETGVIGRNGRVICVADLLTSKKHHFIGFYVQLDYVRKGKSLEESKIAWLHRKSLQEEKMLLDDNMLVVSRFLDNPLQYVSIHYDEEKNIAKIIIDGS